MLGYLLDASLTAAKYVVVPFATTGVAAGIREGAHWLAPELFHWDQTPEQVEANSTKLALVMSGAFALSVIPVMQLSDSTPLKMVSALAAGIYCRSVYENPSMTPGGQRTTGTPLIDFMRNNWPHFEE